MTQPREHFTCRACGRPVVVQMSTAARKQEQTCPFCGAVRNRAAEARLGLLSLTSQPVKAAGTERARFTTRAGFTISNVTVMNARGLVHMNGGHANIDGVNLVDTQSLASLENVATVDVQNVKQTFSKRSNPAKRGRSKRKQSD